MGLIQRFRPHRAETGAVPGQAPQGADASDDQPSATAVLHRLRGTCPHCHKAQQVDSPTTWTTTPCSYCSAPVTLHA